MQLIVRWLLHKCKCLLWVFLTLAVQFLDCFRSESKHLHDCSSLHICYYFSNCNWTELRSICYLVEPSSRRKQLDHLRKLILHKLLRSFHQQLHNNSSNPDRLVLHCPTRSFLYFAQLISSQQRRQCFPWASHTKYPQGSYYRTWLRSRCSTYRYHHRYHPFGQTKEGNCWEKRYLVRWDRCKPLWRASCWSRMSL